ncbi:hypothetical protein P3T23_001155 [Paraburkholderia sp. GAS448]
MRQKSRAGSGNEKGREECLAPFLKLPCSNQAFLADCVGGGIEFLIQDALFVAGKAAAVLRRHVVGFLADHVEAVMECAALGRRIVTLIHAHVDAVAQIIDAFVDLIEALHRHFVSIRARLGGLLRSDHARSQ